MHLQAPRETAEALERLNPRNHPVRRPPRIHGIYRERRPVETIELLRKYHGLIGELLPIHHGTLEHFAGDEVMVFFNDPVLVEDHELESIRMALGLQERFRDLAKTWHNRGSDIGLGIGIAAGYATLGRIGFDGRYDYK
jgi:class 3 adenylate cyclase